VLAVVAAVVSGASPARADYDDTHYYLTYVVARIVGYTPEQAYRVAAAGASVNVSTATWPRQMDAADFAVGADPDSPERQRARWAFHAYMDTAAWMQAERSQKPMPDLWKPRASTLRAIALNPSQSNPGVLVHYLQDQLAHQKLLSNLDGYLRATAGPGWFNFRGNGAELVRVTAEALEASLADLAPTSQRTHVQSGDRAVVADAFRGANPAPAELTSTDESVYVKWALSQLNPLAPTRPFTQEQLATMQRYWRGPDLVKAALTAESLLKFYNMAGPIPDVAQARREFQLDANGKVSAAQADRYVLTGALRVTLQSADGTPQQPVELVIKGLPARANESEYELTKTKMNVPNTIKVEHLPIGKVHLELRRDGELVQRQENVVLDKRDQEVVLKVGAPAGPVWVLKEGFPKINPDNAPTPTNTPAAAGFPWGESLLTRLSPAHFGRRLVAHDGRGGQTGYSFDWILSQAPPRVLEWNRQVDITITGQVGPAAPPWEAWLDFKCYGLRAWSDTDPGGVHQIMTFGELGTVRGKLVSSTNETLHFTPRDYVPVYMTLSIGPAWTIKWEWQKQATALTTVQQPTTPTTPTTPTAPTTPTPPTPPTTPTVPTTPAGPAPKLGWNVKTVQGPDGPRVIVGEIPADNPWAGIVEPGEWIRTMDGVIITSVDQIRQILSKKKPGDELELQLQTPDGFLSDMTVRLE
jgi:hypothetical protein